MRVIRSSVSRAAVLAMALMAAAPAFGAGGDITREDLQQLEAERRDALAALAAIEHAEIVVAKDLGNLERDLIAAAMESQRREEQATASELKLHSLRARLGSARRELVDGNEQLDDLMASLAVSGRHRPPALVSNPLDANSAIRAAILMGHAAPLVKEQTTALGEEITQLRKLERDVTYELARLNRAEAALALKQEEIMQMAAAKRSAFEDVSGDAATLRKRADLLGHEADNIRSLLAALEEAAPQAPGMKPRLQYAAASPNPAVRTDAPKAAAFAGRALLGGLTQPTSGRVTRAWGDAMPGGSKSEGLTFTTRASAQVTAPVDAYVEFAGPFRTYGQLLILSTSDGYHVLLSGMADAYVGVGQSVKSGEPVARMPNRAIPEPELYMEVRKNGKPMNPANWMQRG